MEKQTPLYACHVELDGKMVPFAGYLLPVQYAAGLVKEHLAVRQACGLFDVSHMGEVLISGADALAFVQLLTTNDMSGMVDGQVRYSPICNEQGGIVDDILVYRLNEEKYLLVVNASNRAKDVAWMQKQLTGAATLEDISDTVAQIALQGPRAPEIMQKLVVAEQLPQKYYHFVTDVDVQGCKCLISRTGYTGELGYEIYCANADAPLLWQKLMEAGAEFGLLPCGLGARDTLRLEASMPLYGHELAEDITPLEAGLGFFVKLESADFIGKQALLDKGEPQRVRVGLKITGRGIAREQCPVLSGEQQIGLVTSGTHCPYLNQPLAMALLEKQYAAPGTPLTVDIRGRKVTAEVVELPFYKRPK